MAIETAVATAAARLAVWVADLLQLNRRLKELIDDIEGRMVILKDLSTIIDKVIQHFEACSVRDEDEKNMLKDLKYLAYDLEDTVDYYGTEALRKQRSRGYFMPVRDFFSSDNQLVFKSRISGMIKAATERLDSILLRKGILHSLLPATIQMSSSDYREIHPGNSFFIGRETEKEEIVSMLINDDESSDGTMKVIAIVGMGGMGKTTLARHVFDDKRVKAHFENFCKWKTVGQKFDPTDIMKSVLELVTGASVDISEPELKREKLKNALSGKKFLLVLDDMWNENEFKWGELKTAFTSVARGSKILMTTRSREVSAIMGSFKAHPIQQLPEDDCLSLFQQFAFGGEEANENLMEIGRKIVKKCGGMPLAAISLGSMLHSTRDEIYWSSVLNSEIWQLEDEKQKILSVLKWSYDALPPQSKKCFIFGSLFPKNYVMAKDELIQLWMANGFIRSKDNFDAETVGNRVFNDLVSRSFFLSAPSENYDDDCDECTMHDLMHDLAQSVSEGEYYSLEFSQINNDIQNRTYHLRMFRCAILSNHFQRPLYLRTLILRTCELHQNTKLLQLIFSELKFLRVLDLSGNFIRKVPTSIGNLIHLRYLDLSENNFKVLPDTITALQNLQYLDLNWNDDLRGLPKKLRNLQSLRYLDCNYCDSLTHMPLGLSQLTCLRSLPCFVGGNRFDSCSIAELEGLKLRGKMTIKFFQKLRNYSCGGRKVLKNKDFNELSLSFNDSPDSVIPDGSETNDMSMLDDLCPNTGLKKLKISYYGSRQFPTWLMESQLPNLIEVTLEECDVCEHIPHFGNLQYLRKLAINGMPGVKRMGAEFHGHGTIRGFPSLQELQLLGMTDLEEWSSESDGVAELFPSLKKLKICVCPKLKTMPRLPRIEHFDLYHCSESLLSCVGRMTSLSHLSLESMKGMTSLPSDCVRNLTSLTTLKIKSCKKLQFLPWDEMQSLISLSIKERKNLTSLKFEVGRLGTLGYLCLSNCESLVSRPEIFVQILNSLQRFDIDICHKNVNLCGQLQHFHTLEHLSITDSHNYIYNIRKEFNGTSLSICCCDELESLMSEEPSTSVLESLYIEEIPNLSTLPKWLLYLGSLRRLSIENCCPQLRPLPGYLQNLRLLNYLDIRGCSPQLEILVEIFNLLPKCDIHICHKKVNLHWQLQHFHTLGQLSITGSHNDHAYSIWQEFNGASLSICCCYELESLMAGAPSTSALENLFIKEIPNLRTLPEWLQYLISLCRLSICNCPQLRSLPRWLRNLPLLNNLNIQECSPQLESRCKRETGKDWPIISHVSNIFIYPKGDSQHKWCLQRR